MAAALFLLGAVVLAFVGGTADWVLIAIVALATAAGTTLPDLDTPLRLGHRSALLHSILPSCIALLDRRTWSVAAGLGLGIGFHLAADLFPRTMRGFATIKLPGWGSIGTVPSYGWIIVNMVGNMVAAVVVLDGIASRQVAGGALAGAAVFGTIYLLRTDGGWKALLGFTLIGWLVLH